MQFHHNGFRTGDPTIAEAIVSPVTDTNPAEVDVLIVGCGPAGLTLAAQLSAFADIKTCIVEQKDGPLQLGQADGVACRTMEMFNAFGFVDKVLNEAYWVNETTFWKPDDSERNNIIRHGRIQDTEDGLSEFPHVILNQARVHQFYLDVMRASPRRLEPTYGRRFVDLSVDEKANPNFPVTVRLERLMGSDAGKIETIRARYVVGCDGARSNVRKALGQELKGDSANQAWGVMDVLAVTDFPDIRLKSVIHSAEEGNIIIIPREGGYLVRFYIEMGKLRSDERISNRNLTADNLIAAANRILHPYTLDVRQVAWWSVYEIGQRLCDRFDDTQDDTALPRVFITGDACHTHSPKAGQGMNVSMQDAFNLGWKLAAVLRGQAKSDLLRTYSEERQKVAKVLIDFDRELARMMSARPKISDDDLEGVSPAEFKTYFEKQGRYTAGTATHYQPSLITGTDAFQHLATGFAIGTRFHSAPVVRLADAKPMQLGHAAMADGRWRLYAFAGSEELSAPETGINALCRFLENDPGSPIKRYTPENADIDAVFDLRVIFQESHRDIKLETLPRLLLPFKGCLGVVDYEKAFCRAVNPNEDIFEMRGVDRRQGCLVVVRPDQYIAQVLPLDGYDALSEFFGRIFVNET